MIIKVGNHVTDELTECKYIEIDGVKVTMSDEQFSELQDNMQLVDEGEDDDIALEIDEVE